MQTKSIVQSSANVIRIVNLQQGDLYKRFDDSSYSKQTFYGIVQNIYNDGEKTFIESVEYKTNYGDIEASIYVIRGDADVSIFPATLEEVETEFARCEQNTVKKIKEKEEEIIKLNKVLQTTKDLVSGQLQAKLQQATFKTVTQAEYNEKVRATEQRKLEAESSDF